MSHSLRVVITFTFVPAVAAAVILGLGFNADISFGLLFAGVALPAAAAGYWLLKSADVPPGFAIGGALAVIVLSYVLVLAIIAEYLVN